MRPASLLTRRVRVLSSAATCFLAGLTQADAQTTTVLRGELLLRDGRPAETVRLVIVGHPPEVVVQDGGLFSHPLSGTPAEITARVVGQPDVVAVPVLVITNSWQVEGQGRSFQFNADQDDSEGLEQGTFTGVEQVDDPFAEYELTGSWADGQIEFTVERPGGDVAYTATFNQDRPTRLTVHSAQPAETITIVRSEE